MVENGYFSRTKNRLIKSNYKSLSYGVADEADNDRMRKVIIETSALVIEFSHFNASAMAADDNGRVTFHGQLLMAIHLVYSATPTTIGRFSVCHQNQRVLLRGNLCGVETLQGITASQMPT